MIPERLRLLCAVLLIAGTLAVVCQFLMHLPPTWLPLSFSRSNPARLLSLFVVSYAALVLGVLSREGGEKPAPLLATVLIVLLLVGAYWYVTRGPVPKLQTYIICTMTLGGAMTLLQSTKVSVLFELNANPGFGALLNKCQVPLLLGLAVFVFANNWRNFSWEVILKRRALSHAAYRQAATSETGLLLAASDFTLAQLRTRRAVLFDVTYLDALCYAPKAAPTAASMLSELYGIDFFNPPAESLHQGGLLPGGIERGLWESWSPEKWEAVRKKYRVIDVLVPADWKLQLPVKRGTMLEASFAGQGAHQIGLIYHIP